MNFLHNRLQAYISQVDPSRKTAIVEGIRELLAASNYATIAKQDPWQFAVSSKQLGNLGLTECDLRALVNWEIVKTGVETRSPTHTRQFHSPDIIHLIDHSTCYSLTDVGFEFAEALFSHARQSIVDQSSTEGEKLPQWNRQSRELRLDQLLVKKFKWIAANHEAVLNAFQEENWPQRIFDPLQPDDGICPKRRLHDTIKCLNQRHVTRVIRFHGDGTGEGVEWNYVSRAEN